MKPIDTALIRRAVDASRLNARRRVILPLHGTESDPYQRMLNAMQPGSYARPHRHIDPPKSESIVLLRGSLGFVAFDESGKVKHTVRLHPSNGVPGVDVDPGVFHTFFALEPDSVVFEAKSGPYAPIDEKDFANWAPAEDTPEVASYLGGLMALFLVPAT
ncbi:MAG: WbuC family cupin fold metalloprotein [Gemmatimonadales bacterium]